MYGPLIEQRFGWFGGPNAAGFLLLGIFPFIILQLLRVRSRMRIFHIALVVSVAITVFITYFRTNWIIFLIQIFVLLIYKRKELKRSLFVVFVLLIVLGFLITPQKYAVEARIDDFHYLQEGDPLVARRAGSGRVGIWQDNIDAFKNASLFTIFLGRGMGASRRIEGRHEAHNDFINILSNNGLIGLVLYLWLLISIFKMGRRLSVAAPTQQSQNVACCFWMVYIGWVVRAILTGTIFSPSGMWYVVAAIGMTYTYNSIQDRSIVSNTQKES